jgi:hypothetical protein
MKTKGSGLESYGLSGRRARALPQKKKLGGVSSPERDVPFGVRRYQLVGVNNDGGAKV